MKPWINRLQQHVATWNQKLPKQLASYVYRFDELENVVEILKQGELLSRQEAARRGITYKDCAAPAVIANTVTAHKDYVRLYFYPLTPTQYNTEGIRPGTCITSLGAHCPVPIFMLFDFVALLAQDDTQFSTGNMATGSVSFGSSQADFDKIDFALVYHRGSTWGHPHASTITFHRHAEVLVPVRLPTSGIKKIVCRSHPERWTLLHLLGKKLSKQYENLVEVQASNFFEREWAFVDEVTPEEGSLKFRFHPPSGYSDPMKVEFKYEDTKHIWTLTNEQHVMRKAFGVDLRNALPTGIASLRIEGHLAFRDHVTLSDDPF